MAKIDLAEAFEPVSSLRDFVFVLIMAVIILSILVAFIVAKSLSDPIHALQQGVLEISGRLESLFKKNQFIINFSRQFIANYMNYLHQILSKLPFSEYLGKDNFSPKLGW